ncbi:N-acetyltransferase family protein [Actinomadura kijaniata]|uniref:GNAT family N-acetyltransferase n=1 Tax=Actinomadura kijaniata TaxID=46161 RepID=UPI003F1D22C6
MSFVSDLQIRWATPADDAALAELDARTWSTVSAVAPRPEPGEPFFGEKTRPESILVAERDGRVVGYAKLAAPYPFPSGAHVRSIHGLAVDPGERGRGIGRALMEAACDRAREQGARRITLRVLGGNDPARRLYESLGFNVEGVLPGEFFLDGRYADDVLMGRPL